MLQLGSDIKFNGLSFLHCVLIVLGAHVITPGPSRGCGWALLDGVSMEDCGFFLKRFSSVYCVTFSSLLRESA